MNNKDLTFEEKIQKLKEMHADSAADSRAILDKWEETYIKLKAEKEWQEHPLTEILRKAVNEQVKAIKIQLSTNAEATEAQRIKLFASLDVHESYLVLLNSDPEDAMRKLEESVNNEL